MRARKTNRRRRSRRRGRRAFLARLYLPAARLLLALVLAAVVGAGAPAKAQTRVDLQLVLAVDASGSVNQVRFELQKQGYVAAFRNPRLLAAIRSGSTGAVAVTMTQWTGPALQI